MKYYILPSDTDMQHHGILGQKWGKRNGPPYPLDESVSTGSKLKEKKKKEKPLKAKKYDRKKSNVRKEALKKDINKMSNDELRKYNDRLRLEQDFSRLAKGKKGLGERAGESVSNKMIEEYSKQLVTSIAAVATVAAGKELVKRLAMAVLL